MDQKPYVFVSHVSEDERIVTRFTNWLKIEYNINVFFSRDATSIPLGSDWFKEINQALSKADVVLVMCSHEAMEGKWIHYETAIAIHMQKTVTGLCLPGFELKDLPWPFSSKQCYELEESRQFNKFIEALSRILELPEPDFVTDAVIKKMRGIRSTVTIEAENKIEAYRKRTIHLLKAIKEKNNSSNSKKHMIRQAGSLSSFAISEGEKVPGDISRIPGNTILQNGDENNYGRMTYHDLLIEEKNTFYKLVNEGVNVRIIIRPGLLLARVILDKIDEQYVKKNVLPRYDELISAIIRFKEKPNFQIVASYDLHHGNVQIINESVMFIGIKSVKDYGFSTTEKIFHPEKINSEIKYFDDLFRDNVDNILNSESPSPENVFGSPDLKDKVIERLQLIQVEILKHCQL